MSYEKKLRLRLVLLAFVMLCGVVSIAVSLLFPGKISDFSRGYFSGAGAGLIATGAVLLIKKIAILKSAEKMRAARIREEDERDTALNRISSNVAFITALLLLFFGSIYFAFYNEEVVHVLACFIFISVAAKFISYFILQKHM